MYKIMFFLLDQGAKYKSFEVSSKDMYNFPKMKV